MPAQNTTTLTRRPSTGDPPTRPGLRVVRVARPRRMFRAFAVATAALVATGGYVHFCLYRHGYRTIPKIGVGFLLQVVSSAVVVMALLLGPHLLGRVAHVTDRLAGTLTGLAAAALATGTLVAFALTRTPGGLFNFQERGLHPAPQALIALVAEIGVLVVVGAWFVAERGLQRRVRSAPTPGCNPTSYL
ncbi:MAG: hypothetical protein JWM72_2580 [Actinomycetia bacterium]|nr:hypothetical protein [Actinomycetes bacterium]